MDLKKRILAISAVIIVCLSIVCMGIENNYFKIGEGQSLISSRASLKLWYTDDELTDYISRVALKFFEETNIRVIPVQMSGLEYVERIYDASIGTNDYPDLFFVSNDSLEKAYLAGVASVIQEEEAFVNEDNYSKAALEAVTYKDKLVAYPASFETSVLLYNETYLMEYLEKIGRAHV